MPTLVSVAFSLFGIFVVRLLLRLRGVARNVGSACFLLQNRPVNRPQSRLPQQSPWAVRHYPPGLCTRILDCARSSVNSLSTPGLLVVAQEEI